MISHCNFLGIAKSNIEGALAGLPMILNKPTNSDSDFDDSWILMCDDSTQGYAHAIGSLVNNKNKRELLGKAAARYALKNFDPSKMEQSTVRLYLDVLSGKY